MSCHNAPAVAKILAPPLLRYLFRGEKACKRECPNRHEREARFHIRRYNFGFAGGECS